MCGLQVLACHILINFWAKLITVKCLPNSIIVSTRAQVSNILVEENSTFSLATVSWKSAVSLFDQIVAGLQVSSVIFLAGQIQNAMFLKIDDKFSFYFILHSIRIRITFGWWKIVKHSLKSNFVLYSILNCSTRIEAIRC